MKVNEWAGVGNHMSYKDREFDPRIARWITLDPIFKSYPEYSPYNFALNSPIMFKDSKGRWVEGADGKRVSYKILSSGQVQWKNATADVQRVGNAMLKTQTGRDVFNAMKDATYPISIKIDNTTVKQEANGGVRLGETKTTGTYKTDSKGQSTLEFKRADITIFDKAINEHVMGNDAIKLNGTDVNIKGLSKDDIIGSVGTHEGTHSTDKKSNSLFNKSGTEKKPYENQEKSLKESKDSKESSSDSKDNSQSNSDNSNQSSNQSSNSGSQEQKK